MPKAFSAEATWLLADTLARSGRFKTWRDVEQELIALNHSRAASLLNTTAQHIRLDGLCKAARKIPSA
jgi:hypothetical protein